jgi:flagellar protein FlaG
MDIQGLMAVAPATSGVPAAIDKTSQAVAVADATAAASPISLPAASEPRLPGAIAAELQAFLHASQHMAQTMVQYGLDAKTGMQVITVRDAQSGQIIRQMPPDVAVRLLKNFSMGTGTLLDSSA